MRRPIGASMTALIGTSLVLLNTALIAAADDVLWYRFGNTTFVFGFEQFLDRVAFLLATSSLGVVSAALIALVPRYRVVFGLAVITSSLLGLLAGGGFLLGVFAGVIGAIWAILWKRPLHANF